MASYLPPTEARVPQHAPKGANLKVRDAAIRRVHAAASASGDELDRRLARLRREWDMERTLEFNASIAAGIGLALGMTGRPGWLWLSVGVLSFLFQHAVQGWCPPMVWFRWMGWRTAEEINDEATALRVLRGDLAFAGAGKGGGGAPGAADLAERMALNMRTQGAFVGAGAAVAEAESAGPAAKEE